MAPPSPGPALARPFAKNRRDGARQISIAVVVSAIGLLAIYALRPGTSPADDAQTAEAIRKMDQAQNEANAKRDEQRSATSLL